MLVFAKNRLDAPSIDRLAYHYGCLDIVACYYQIWILDFYGKNANMEV